MTQPPILAALLAALVLPAAAAATDMSVEGYRSNYAVTRSKDGTVTIARLRDGAVQTAGTDVGSVRFLDDYVSFDTTGVPGQAYRLYQAAFNRAPDQAGLGFWIGAMQGGYPLESVAGNFYDSAEFQDTYGQVNDLQFLTLLYKNVLHRVPDQGGQDFWLKQMAAGLSRPAVLRYFSESDENVNNVATAVANGITYAPAAGSEVTTTLQHYAPPATPSARSVVGVPGLAAAELAGAYQRLPVLNGFHSGRLSVQASGAALQWTNDSQVSWTLTPDLQHGLLLTDASNPYQNVAGGRDFTLAFAKGKLAGFYFQGEFYARDGVPLAAGVTPNLGRVSEDSSGFHGYLAHGVAAIPAGYDYGFSQYVAMWPQYDKPLEHYQAGLGMWVIPDNGNYQQALLPPDNAMRQSTPAGAPNWAYVFQTIEGGMGNWQSTQFPVRDPKFAIVGTIDGYAHLMGSPGWGFGQPEGLPRDYMAIAQLSNRILVPPDGFTFKTGTAGEFFGYAWMALPLTEARQTSVPIGSHSWTLFFNAANFSGPVAFWVPDAWTILSRSWANARARGLDTLSARSDSTAIEFGNIPSFHNGDNNGNLVARVPRMLFPTDANGVSYLAADRANYSSGALFEPMRGWFNGGAVASGTFSRAATYALPMERPSFVVDFKNMPITGLEKYVSPVVSKTPGGGAMFGLQWTRSANQGVLPEYFRQNGSQMEAIDAADVPAETMLGEVSFAEVAGRGAAYTSPSTGASSWMSPAPAAGPFQAELSDGSVVTYYWYKFIDQPSVQNYGWSSTEKASLQARVEQIHRAWAGTREFMAPPTAGALATLDAALLVKPPSGLEAGYVPVVTAQAKAR